MRERWESLSKFKRMIPERSPVRACKKEACSAAGGRAGLWRQRAHWDYDYEEFSIVIIIIIIMIFIITIIIIMMTLII